MKQIKYRAKTVGHNPIFVYGQLVYSEGISFIITHPHRYDYTDDNDLSFYKWFQVSNDTIGEYTGLKDKNGKEIYEGDILKYEEFGKNKFYFIKYSTEGFDSESYIGAFFLCDGRCNQLICNVNRPYQYAEFAGNIYDNKELLNI